MPSNRVMVGPAEGSITNSWEGGRGVGLAAVV